MNLAKLKKAGFKKAVIKAAAGTPIGCNTCHSIKTSCIGSPVGSEKCGIASEATTASTNQSPSFTAEPGASATNFVYGETPLPYTYSPTASDPDGDSLTYGLSTRLDNMSINPQTGQVTLPDWKSVLMGSYGSGNSQPYSYSYTVTVTDGKGGNASQRVSINLVCPSGKVWGADPVSGSDTCLQNAAPVLQLPPIATGNPGQTLSGTLSSNDPDRSNANQLPVYSQTGAPSGLTLGATSGVMQWTPETVGDFNFSASVSDQSGGTDSKSITLHVCETGKTFSGIDNACVTNQPPTITSTLPGGMYPGTGVGIAYRQTVTATDPDGDQITYGLYGAPQGMTVDANTGLLSWTPLANQGGNASSEYKVFQYITIASIDSKGGVATQNIDFFLVCLAGKTWDFDMFMCMDVTQ